MQPSENLSDPRPGEAFAFEVNGGRGAGATARQAVVAGDGALPVEVRQDVLLLVTELVTNAVRHAPVGPDESVRVELRRWPERVRVAVADPGAGFAPAGPRFSSDEPGGLGLFLVDQIADRWGVDRAGAGNSVWFEIAYEA